MLIKWKKGKSKVEILRFVISDSKLAFTCLRLKRGKSLVFLASSIINRDILRFRCLYFPQLFTFLAIKECVKTIVLS